MRTTLLEGRRNNGFPGNIIRHHRTSLGERHGGDGGYNAIDPARPRTGNVSNPDIAPGGLNVQECSSGVNCRQNNFNVVSWAATASVEMTAHSMFPYILGFAVVDGNAGGHLPGVAAARGLAALYRVEPKLRYFRLRHLRPEPR